MFWSTSRVARRRSALRRWAVPALTLAVALTAGLPANSAQASPATPAGAGWDSPADSWLPKPNDAPSENGLALTPPMVFNSWAVTGCDISQQTFVDAANTLVDTGLAAAGYNYVNIDDCWSAAERDADGNLVADPARFPNGMKWLGDYLHERGLKFGIYADAGTKTCAGYPGSWDHFQQDADTFASWGVDLLKLDGCNLPSIDGQTSDQVLQTAYTQMSEALKATGRPIVYFESAPAYATDLPDRTVVGKQDRQPLVLPARRQRRVRPVRRARALELLHDPEPQDSTSTTEKQAAVQHGCPTRLPAGLQRRHGDPDGRGSQDLSNPAVIAVNQDPYGAQGTSVGTVRATSRCGQSRSRTATSRSSSPTAATPASGPA